MSQDPTYNDHVDQVGEFGGPRLDQATVRRFFMDYIVRELRPGDPEDAALLARYGYPTRRKDQPYDVVPLDGYIRFFEDVALRLDRSFLGFELGQAFQLWEYGPFYALLTTSASVRAALDVFSRFQSVWQTHTLLSVQRELDETKYSYIIDDQRIWPRIQDSEFAMAGFCSMVRQLGSERWSPVSVSFEHDIGSRKDVLSKYFRCPVSGNAASNSIVARDGDLDRPTNGWLRASDPGRRVVERHLRVLMAPQEEAAGPLPDRVAQLIAQKMGRGTMDLEAVAADLNMAPRSLRRQLMAFGTSFSEILLRERQKKAADLIRGGTIKMDALAARLGYSSQSVFSRAYRDWTGNIPSADRQKARTAR